MNELLSVALWGTLVFTVLGLIFGIALAATARRFHVPVNPIVEEVKDNLPAANCGACGFGACQAYAEQVVENPDVAPTLCAPGGKEVAVEIGHLTGKEVGEMRDEVARLRCYGSNAWAKQQAEYDGINTCVAATLSFGGPKSCKFGCLGLGDCVRVCQFDAMHVGELGIVEIDVAKCTGCGVCIDACPKNVLLMYPRQHRVVLSCLTQEKGKAVKDTCMVGCIQCQLCIKACPAKAIDYRDGAIDINHFMCRHYGPGCEEVCVEVCPTDIIHLPGMLPDPDKKAKAKAAQEPERAAAQ